MLNASGDMASSSGFLPSVVCPGPTAMTQTSANLSQTPTSFSEPLNYVFVVVDRFCSYSNSFTGILQVWVP
jgi:hypothetical protein